VQRKNSKNGVRPHFLDKIMNNFSITNIVENDFEKIEELDIPFDKIKEASLGKDYELSLVFTTSEKIKKLNQTYRNKNSTTDILSFPISETEGEIHICLEEAKKESEKFDRDFKNFIAFLFIHGCVHLKGHDHGSTMEDIEVDLRKKFNI
jgi:rRNA maturation RNase YbeY